MKKPAPVKAPSIAILSQAQLAAAAGGDGEVAASQKVVGVWKLGNKEWNDDWLAPK